MSGDRHIYGEINNKTGMRRVFTAIRRDVEDATSWDQKFGKDAVALRGIGEDEFRKTARKINRHATEIGTDADYDEKWGNGR